MKTVVAKKTYYSVTKEVTPSCFPSQPNNR